MEYGIVRQVFSYPSANESCRNRDFSSLPLRSCPVARGEAVRLTYPSQGYLEHSRDPVLEIVLQLQQEQRLSRTRNVVRGLLGVRNKSSSST